jgi:DNA-binding NtrC family response regulator
MNHNSNAHVLPRLLVIDDELGQPSSNNIHSNRFLFCTRNQIRDITGDAPVANVEKPIADAVFFHGQKPKRARLGDIVENDLDACMNIIRSGWPHHTPERPRWSMLILDLCFYTGRVTTKSQSRGIGSAEGRPRDSSSNHYFGIEILKRVQKSFPDLPVVVISTMEKGDVSEKLSKLGYLGFYQFGKKVVHGSESFSQVVFDNALYPDPDGLIIGHSIKLLKALRQARRAARSNKNILIRGERGTGKELMASYIHKHSLPHPNLKARPYVTVDSGTLTEELYQSELFGHKKGTFTGGNEDRIGKFIYADNGDLFLDEVGNMHQKAQEGLLRAVQEQKVLPLGGKTPIPVRVRLIAATNADIEMPPFRQDLRERLTTAGTVFLPPLRERLEDLPYLVEAFLQKIVKEENARSRSITHEAQEKLRCYPWSGNVRQLYNVLQSAVANYKGVEHLVPTHLDLEAVVQTDYFGSRSQEPHLLSQNLNVMELLSSKALYDFPEGIDESNLESVTQAAAALVLGYINRCSQNLNVNEKKDFPALTLLKRMAGKEFDDLFPQVGGDANKAKSALIPFLQINLETTVSAIRESESMEKLVRAAVSRNKGLEKKINDLKEKHSLEPQSED